MNDDELDRMERQALETINHLRREYERAVSPYVKILADIQSLRPRVFYAADGRLMVPMTGLSDEVGDTQ